MNKKNIIIFFSLVFIGFIILVTYQVVISTNWYHWKKVNNFRESPVGPGSYPGDKKGQNFIFHLNKLIDAGEIKYQEFIINNSIPVEKTIVQIRKKFPDLIWLQLLSYPDPEVGMKAADDNDESCRVNVWTKSSDMKEFKKFIKNREKTFNKSLLVTG